MAVTMPALQSHHVLPVAFQEGASLILVVEEGMVDSTALFNAVPGLRVKDMRTPDVETCFLKSSITMSIISAFED